MYAEKPDSIPRSTHCAPVRIERILGSVSEDQTLDAESVRLQLNRDKIARTGPAAFVEQMTMVQIKSKRSKPGGSEA